MNDLRMHWEIGEAVEEARKDFGNALLLGSREAGPPAQAQRVSGCACPSTGSSSTARRAKKRSNGTYRRTTGAPTSL